MRYGFWSVFAEADDGRLCARWPLNLNGVSLRAGDRICPGASFSGFNPYRVKDRDLEGWPRGGELVIQAVYHHAHDDGGVRSAGPRAQALRAPRRPPPRHATYGRNESPTVGAPQP